MRIFDRLSPLALLVSAACLLWGATTVWVAMHQNLYGTGGQFVAVFERAWNFLALNQVGYPVVQWADGFLLRPGLITFSVGYLILLVTLRHSRIGDLISLPQLLAIAVMAGIPFLLMPYMMSSDVFDYISYGRLPVVHASNPYLSSISEFPADPFYPVTFWKATPSVYGPAWTLLSMGLVSVANVLGGSVAVTLFMFRATALAFQIVAAVCIWNTLGSTSSRDKAFRTALFVLNPLVMVEFPGNGHNEAMMIALIAAGLAAEQRGRWVLAGLFLTLAVQTKLYCLPLLCLYIAYRCWSAENVRHATRRIFSLALVSVGVSALLYAPFGMSLGIVLAPLKGPGAEGITKSLVDFLLSHGAGDLGDLPVIGILFRGYLPNDLRRLTLLLTLIVCIFAAYNARSLSRSVTAMGAFAFFWCVIGATWFMPWYVTLAVALVPLTRSRSLLAGTLVLSFTVFTIHLLEGNSFSTGSLWHNRGVDYFQLLIFVPSILAFLVAQSWDFYGERRGIGTLPPKNG